MTDEVKQIVKEFCLYMNKIIGQQERGEPDDPDEEEKKKEFAERLAKCMRGGDCDLGEVDAFEVKYSKTLPYSWQYPVLAEWASILYRAKYETPEERKWREGNCILF